MTHLTVGDPAPWFVGRTTTSDAFHFETVAGRYIVLCFFGFAALEPMQRLLALLSARSDVFNDDRASFFGVSLDPDDERLGRIRARPPGFRFFCDTDRTISARYGVLRAAPADRTADRTADPAAGQGTSWQFAPCSLVLDPDLRVRAVLALDGPEEHAARLLGLLERLPALGAPTRGTPQAPILVIPRVFPPELCAALIDAYRTHGGRDSGYMVQRDGRTVGVVDYRHKRRRDADIGDEALRRECQRLVQRRVVPELRKAYQFEATRMERYIVACYDSAEQSHFRRHRDNTTKGTAHRRFAVSICLNDDYEGGEVWFPEYGRQRFKGPKGGAIVFSCSVLHEVTPVTAGVRYTFLPFLYDEAAARQRVENNPFLDDAIRPYCPNRKAEEPAAEETAAAEPERAA